MIVPNTPSTTSETVERDEFVVSLTARTSCDLFNDHLLSDTSPDTSQMAFFAQVKHSGARRTRDRPA
jgi:hypothetical protein